MTQHVPIQIRKSDDHDYAVCADIYENAWNGALPNVRRTISISEFMSEIEGELTLVAILDEQIVGYVSIWEPDWFIHHLYVDTAHHGYGVGKSLMTHTEKMAVPHPVSLKCQLANTGAMEFYGARGFVETAEAGVNEYGGWVRLQKNTA